MTDREKNTAEDLIANLGEEDNCTGHYLKASVRADGHYTITNSRNNVSRTYAPR